MANGGGPACQETLIEIMTDIHSKGASRWHQYATMLFSQVQSLQIPHSYSTDTSNQALLSSDQFRRRASNI